MKTYCAIYDFALLPYALGDVMTWCVKTAMKAKERDCRYVDIYIRVSSESYAINLQTKHVCPNNYQIFLSELYPAFQAHPLLRNLHIFSDPDNLLKSISAQETYEDIETHEVESYKQIALEKASNQDKDNYLICQVKAHNDINQYYDTYQEIPKLKTSVANSDLDFLFSGIFKNKFVVLIQPRLRKVDRGFGGDLTYNRDSDYLEWFDFIHRAEEKYPQVIFVLLGRLSEKPLSLLRLKNVFSLRTLGCTLIHEIGMFERSHLFIGASSGFAAVANFTNIPYYITKITQNVCKVYEIPYGSSRLPFASPSQTLVYQDETSHLFSELLEKKLSLSDLPSNVLVENDTSPVIDLFTTEYEFRAAAFKFSTVSRVDISKKSESLEVALVLKDAIRQGFELANKKNIRELHELLNHLSNNFSPQLDIVPEYWKLYALISRAKEDKLQEQLYEKKFQDLAKKRSIWLCYRSIIWYSKVFLFKELKLVAKFFSIVSKKLKKSIKSWTNVNS
ncbi:hypothetical protein [Spirulina major]|uniref:hypothetical protein n=1 Tax=Spirulina major TaxID=270636 RepID=UPI000932B8B7|nr:hypothetical protein [Spirulina major]